MTVWEAPAKINLSLELRPPDSSGLHPLRSLAQTVDWCDRLSFEEADEDALVVEGADLPEGGDNLIWKALTALRQETGRNRPFLSIALTKSIAVAAGLGGGSSDAAAALSALASLLRVPQSVVETTASKVGSDVPFMLTGGLAWMEGYGEGLTPTRLNPDYGVGIVVPPFELATTQVYRKWDQLDFPAGRPVAGRALPPVLRDLSPFRNDLTAAAVSIRPELGDFISDLEGRWERPVLMSGSGPSLFGFFRDLDEARDAVAVAPRSARSARAAFPRDKGVGRL
jgi:4-diphosphocytidyl-2-C-methyl-D-erythritol kinase